ncbi:S8 family peptidase [Clostridium sp. UBA6640]|uniref:S8 family peptidase n=1 Tax=Clostridium sp. UBA6640 TaxID=1946370 RepID=UPI0025C0B6CA|nr:S8 family peptidase [Clostridium sp. UBA6640]
MEEHRENINEMQENLNAHIPECGKRYLSNNYESYIAEYSGNIINQLNQIDYACAFIVGNQIIILIVENGRLDDLLRDVPALAYVERNELYSLTQISPINAANISIFHTSSYLRLRGTGVVVGMLDTGIDYLNREFMTEDNKTRIIGMWDQTIQQGPPPEGFKYGTEYSREQINEAISAQSRGEDPYAIVPQRDEIGHGTEIAGIIGAGGRAGVTGAAPDCEFLIVKLKEASPAVLREFPQVNVAIPEYQTSDILLALKYLYDTQRRLNKPMAICIALGTNSGGHDGSARVERYIDYFSVRSGIAVVGGTGNEGDAENHTSGIFTESGEVRIIELQVADNQFGIEVNIWFHRPDRISAAIISPSGEILEKIPEKVKGIVTIRFTLEGTTVAILHDYPESITGDGRISIAFTNVKGGIWQIVLTGDYIVDGRYNAWTYQKDFLMPGTKFLEPDPYTTLTIPSTSRTIIATAYYNQFNNTVVATSGRGFTRDGRVKPSVATGGVNVVTTRVGGGTTIITGSSAATAVLTGAVALILQWGVVEGNNPALYPPKINTFLIAGTRKRPGDTYPNPVWGYGMLDLMGVFQNIRSLDNSLMRSNKNKENLVEFTENIFINIPENIYTRLD